MYITKDLQVYNALEVLISNKNKLPGQWEKVWLEFYTIKPSMKIFSSWRG